MVSGAAVSCQPSAISAAPEILAFRQIEMHRNRNSANSYKLTANSFIFAQRKTVMTL
jgi:hypothetical protein